MEQRHLDLLKDEKVRHEIERFKWIESEKAGYDIGFENASRTWLSQHGENWINAQRTGKPGNQEPRRTRQESPADVRQKTRDYPAIS